MRLVSLTKKNRHVPFSFKKKTCKCFNPSNPIPFCRPWVRPISSEDNRSTVLSMALNSPSRSALRSWEAAEVRHISQHLNHAQARKKCVKKLMYYFGFQKHWEVFFKGLVFVILTTFQNLTRFQVQVRPHLEILCLLCAVVRHLMDGRYGSMQEKYLANHSLFFHRRETPLQSTPPPKKKKHRCTVQKTT